MIQKVYLGEAALENFYNCVKQLSPQRIFLVRGKKSYNFSGAKEIIEIILSQLNVEIAEFFDFEENPKYEDLKKGLTMMRIHAPDLVIAIGGGSVLDMGKLIRFFYSYAGNPTDNSFKKEKSIVPLIALPTTAGTGSEATCFSVLYKEKIKYSIEHEDMLPDIAIVNPSFTYNNLPYLTACTGFDALAQAIEAYWNMNATNESDKYAEKAIKLLWPNLPLAINCPTKNNRDKISEGSYWAGKAINITKTTAPHAFSYPFTMHYGYPHGHAVALTFPLFAEINLCNISGNRKNFLLSMLNIQSTLNIKKTFYAYIHLLKLTTSFTTDIDKELILSSIGMERLKNNPVKIDHEIALSILKETITNGNKKNYTEQQDYFKKY